ncbi:MULTISPECIES: DUF3325 family protein [Vreelandella]|uniref:DUF3325 domain-containing protein n=2 Tax=Vreelandella TaxID=3137766 RepID=A0A7C9JVC3_9GAMM|nr:MULTISPECIES: DUF3325 family protein [Halomonas]NDL68946.1 DUF3325 domain-containing protein [Halomonas alkaliphila]NYS44338.1 DUF3325 family protein [Halomonas zhaodongensis]
MMLITILALCTLGFALIALSDSRHRRRCGFKSVQQKPWSWVGSAVLGGPLWLAMETWSTGLAITLWLGCLSISAGCVFVGLAVIERHRQWQ